MADYTQIPFVEALAEEFNLFAVPPTFTSVAKQYYTCHRPTSQITTDSSPIEFSISGQGVDYIDLKHTRLHVKVMITKGDGTPLVNEENTGPANLFLQTLFSQVDVSLNGKLITTSSNLYPYKSYLKVLLNEPNDVKTSVLQSQLYYKDTADQFDEAVVNGHNNGFYERCKWTNLGKTVDMEGPLYEDLMDCKRYLINGVDIKIRMFRTSPAFCLMSSETNPHYKVKIEDVYLSVCKIRPNSSVITSHAKVLQHDMAKYPFTKSEIKVVSLTKGQLNYSVDNLFQNKIPNKVVVALVSAEAVNGSYVKSPFNFKMYDLSSIGLYVNGEPLPGEPVIVEGSNYIRAYNTLFEGRRSVGLNLTRKDFNGGYALYQFILEPYHLKEDYLDLIKRGNLRLELQFNRALPETVNVLIYSEDNLVLSVDNARNILYTPT